MLRNILVRYTCHHENKFSQYASNTRTCSLRVDFKSNIDGRMCVNLALFDIFYILMSKMKILLHIT